jgi:hypothetical protein
MASGAAFELKGQRQELHIRKPYNIGLSRPQSTRVSTQVAAFCAQGNLGSDSVEPERSYREYNS